MIGPWALKDHPYYGDRLYPEKTRDCLPGGGANRRIMNRLLQFGGEGARPTPGGAWPCRRRGTAGRLNGEVLRYYYRHGVQGRAGPRRERIITMVNTLPRPGSEESVTRNLDNAPEATQVPDKPALQDQPPPETPSVFSRFFRSSGVTERKKAANDDTSLPSQNPATFQVRYLELQFDNDAAVSATNTAECAI